MIKILELFGGIEACTKALERQKIPYEIADYVEIDKYAVASYNAIHGTNFIPQDITKWDKDIKVDLIMHGSPCQDFSIAGKQAGGDKGAGTRSSLMYETLRIVRKLKPKYVIWENVKNLLSEKHRHNFQAYQDAMAELGYRNYYKVLNAKDYGVPQNRERVFTVSILGDGSFEFPEPEPLGKRLKDVLEDDVDEKYYLSEKAVAGFIRHNKTHESRGNGFKFEPIDTNKPAHTVSTKAGSRATDNFIQVVGMLGIKGQDQIKRVYNENGISPALSTMQGGNRQPKVAEPRILDAKITRGAMGTVDNYRIRKLTPKECWRLMGFDDSDFEKAEKVNSNTQLYKQAGNSIVVNVLEKIINNIIKEEDA